ncbi:MAG: response regulator [Proteobacteria bacterium]|nr:response regulator [Pseudomonadota bacterium]MBU1714859.1 response regulator [Pseudomonadota bacterium]
MAEKKETIVLVVDDEGSIRKLIRSYLKDINLTNVIEAKDGEEAITILKREEIDLIVSDLRMPRIDGLQLLEKVRANDRLKHIPFVMVTSSDEKEDIVAAMQAKVSQYIIKPFTAETFRSKLKAALK